MSDDSQDILKNIEELKAALEASNKARDVTPVLQVKDLTEISDKYLTSSAKYDLSQKAYNLSVKTDDGQFFRAVYFATRVRPENEERAVQEIAKVINDLSQRGLIHSCLAPISSLELARMTLQAPQKVVFCFVLIPDSYYEDIKIQYKKISIEEGGVGEALEDLSPRLGDGEFLAAIRVTTNYLTLESKPDTQKLLQDQIDQYLAILPKGTVVKEVTQCAVTDLSLPYEVKFYNPLMQKVKYVETEYIRDGAVIDNEFKQFNVFTGVRYFDKERNELYKRN